jgi:protein phosphatase
VTTFAWGSAIHVGQVRQVNQDNLVTEDGLFAVADGMGGHRGGEVASALAVAALRERFTERTSAGLVTAVQGANDVVVAEAGRDPELRGMGTTLAVLALVDDGDHEVLSIANVGDSRIYLLRAESEDLEQITEDHSLVATLQRQGQLSKDEAATHPQRNIITRALGIDTTVLVDSWDLEPVRGDRYLICSDGLFNEVDDARIAATLRRLADPSEAAAELVRQANEHGGRDNISVVVVDVVDAAFTVDRAPGRSEDEATRVVPTVAPDDATGADGALPDTDPAPDGATDPDGTDAAGTERATTTEVPPDPDRPGAEPATAPPSVDGGPEEEVGGRRGGRRRGRRGEHRPDAEDGNRSRFTWRVALFLVALLALAGGTVAVFVVAAGGTYYVAPDGDDVVIWKGRPEGVLWIDPEVAERPDPPFAVDEVGVEFRDDVVEGRDFGDLASARDYVARIRPEPTTTTTTTTRTTTAPEDAPADPGTP